MMRIMDSSIYLNVNHLYNISTVDWHQYPDGKDPFVDESAPLKFECTITSLMASVAATISGQTDSSLYLIDNNADQTYVFNVWCVQNKHLSGSSNVPCNEAPVYANMTYV